MKSKQMIEIIKNRSSGILLHLSSLPCPYGTGDLGPGAYNFVDFLSSSGQSYWQILPTVPTNPVFGNSPYMSFSAFAGNPLFISPDLLLEKGLLQRADLPPAEFSKYIVDFEKIIAWKQKILIKAWQRFKAINSTSLLETFVSGHPWVKDHALFLALKKKLGQKAWYQWPRELRLRNPEALESAREELSRDIAYAYFEQYLFSSQWEKLHAYAGKRGIRIIGDLPIYVGLDSVDVWANQDIFELNLKTGKPTHIAGVPPDYFSKTGQLWGNPLYRWNCRKAAVKQQLYDWWEQRLQVIFSQVDLIRIDHFRGFEAFWSVPAKEKTAINGTWKKGPGKMFFADMEKRLGPLPIIAEDLGLITPLVEKLRDDLGFPGMKILLFAFDGKPSNTYLPHNSIKNCVMYTGTHDNDTAVGWYLSPEVTYESKKQAKRYANRQDDQASSFHKDMIHLAHSSNALLSILPMQDVLGFGNDCRMNTPSTTKGNWQWRCAPRFITTELADWLRDSTAFFGRIPDAAQSKTKKQP